MSNVCSVFKGLEVAFQKKTIKLLQSKHAQVYLSLFKSLFPDTSQGIISDELWSRMDECLRDLEEAGYADLLPKEGGKTKSGRAVCHDLIDRYNWVESKRLEDGQMEYRLTSDAIEALETCERLRSGDTVMTGSRMRTILDQIERAYVRLSPNYDEGLRILQARVGKALDELDAYEAEGGSGQITEAQAADEVANLIDLMSGIPKDLRRLEEDIRANATDIIGRFRDDDRPTGEIIGVYIKEGHRLLDETDHGRSFQDSLSVVGEPSLAGDVDAKLDAISHAPALGDAHWESSRRITDGWNQIANGLVWVNRENSRSTHVINRSIARHDVARDRELTRVLKELEAAAYAWAEGVGPRTEGPITPTMGKLQAKPLRSQPFVPANRNPPPPLVEEDAGTTTLSLEELRRVGGPLTREILDAIAAAAPLGAESFDLAEGFNALSAEARRPVELAGLIQLATTLGLDVNACGKATYECVGLDGRWVSWQGPRITFTLADMDLGRGRLT